MENSQCYLNCVSCPSRPQSVFNDLDSDFSSKLAGKKIITHYRRGETLFLQGTPAFGLYCIGKGKVKLGKINEAGGETILLIASSGHLIGYQDYKLHPEYLSTATALVDCSTCFIPNDYLHNLLLLRPDVAVHLLQQTTRAMEVVSSYGHASLHMNAKNRVASLLLSLSKNFGVVVSGKTKIDLRLTRHEMASMVGTASETMIRSLSEFKQQGILEQQGNFIWINDMERLHELSSIFQKA